jgi:transcriptional regulator of acetoin/glycerol metabolism
MSPAMLDSPMAGLMGVDMHGKIVWRNAAAARLLGMRQDGEQLGSCKVDEVLQSSFSELASVHRATPSLLRLPNGLQVHMRCELRARDGHHHVFAMGLPAHAAPSVNMDPPSSQVDTQADDAMESTGDLPEPASLRDADADLIARTLKDCGGNVSAAARKLQVSRGLIYRRTQGS